MMIGKKKKKGESSTGFGAGTALASAALWTALLGAAGVYHNIDGMILLLPLSMVLNMLDNEMRKLEHSPTPTPSPIVQPIPVTTNTTLKILSYNVCSREDVEIRKRMEAIGELIQLHSPHFLCFQEITPNIYKIFQQSSWWGDYCSSMSEEEASKRQYFCILLSKFRPVKVITAPLRNSLVSRELSVTETKVGSNKSLVVATSHLKSRRADPNDPNSQNKLFSRVRLLQAKEALTILQKYSNAYDVIFCGDMNWNEVEDGEFPLPDGWVDAWTELKGEEEGNTFDTESNEMLKDHPYIIRMRLDRILCNLKGFRLVNIKIIGKDCIPGVFYSRNKKINLPVLPSDHYGLLLTIRT
ncbi:hypothetical protein IFM89_011440 [Coptis chinensis]|uniref:Endonuclease/exonuclease/phosphatase domain-containing protein n=1 Tax=Coptis chinensis TaxID=261450 RepID=A0A835IXG9_9MAGN|nr:hypothetical protein IFM89_011440 [Coptis chinensis]